MPQESPEGQSYRRVVADLYALVANLRDGERLPGVRELAKRNDITIGPVSRALRELQAAGLIEIRTGVGAFVRHFRPITRSSPARLSRDQWGAGYAIQDPETAGRIRVADIKIGEMPAPEWVAGPLGVHPGDPVVFRSRRFMVDGRPVQLATSYLPTDIARGTPLMHTDTGPGGSYARLAELGHAPVRFTEYVRSRMPDPSEAEELRLVGGPVFEITRHAVTEQGRCVEVNRMILDSDVYLLDYTFDAG